METYRFSFTRDVVTVEIEGESFELDCHKITGEYLQKLGSGLKQLSGQMAKGEKNEDDALETGLAVLEELLGPGSADRLSKRRAMTAEDTMELISYLAQVAIRRKGNGKKKVEVGEYLTKREKIDN